jgi:hypothetical protein
MWEAESMAHNPLIYVQGNNVGSVSGSSASGAPYESATTPSNPRR